MKTISKHEACVALCDAAEIGDVAAAQKALEAGASVNGRVEYGKTPIMFAVENAQVGMITFLKSRGARLNMLDEDQEHPLIYAFTNGTHDKNGQEITDERTMEVLRTMLLLGADRDARGEFGTPAFHYAASQLDGKHLVELARMKMEMGALDPFGKSTVLHPLAQNKRIAPAEADLLIALAEADGVGLDQENSNGQSPLFVARRHDNEVFAASLLAAGASPLTPAMINRIQALRQQDQALDAERKASIKP